MKNDRNHLEQVLRELATKIEQVVLDAWKEVFKSNDHNYNINNIQKRIRITYGKDENQKCYLEFFIEDSDGNYKISERSLGFRWFFVFFMFTQFRKVRKSKNRDFASKYPNKISYFQLVLDILEYVPSKLEYIPDVVMIEGKNYFYTLKYFKDVILKDKSKINLLPGLASTSLDNLISLYIGWGRNFIILLDSDNSGKKQKDRYTEKFGSLVENKIFTYEDIDVTWKNVAMERIIGEEECLKIQLNSYPESEKFNKKIFNRSIQEMLIKGEEYKFSNITKDKFKKIFKFLKDKM